MHLPEKKFCKESSLNHEIYSDNDTLMAQCKTGNSIVNALELLESCAKSSIYIMVCLISFKIVEMILIWWCRNKIYIKFEILILISISIVSNPLAVKIGGSNFM